MPRIRNPYLLGAFVLGFLFVGIPFWMVPYSRATVPNDLAGIGMVVVFMLALLLRLSGSARFMATLNTMAMTMPAALMARVLVEGWMDPTRHNLWPLALGIAIATGYATALSGTLLGHVVGRVMGGRRE